MIGTTTNRVALQIRGALRAVLPEFRANLAWRVHPDDYARLQLECGSPGKRLSAPGFIAQSIEIMGVPVSADPRVEELK